MEYRNYFSEIGVSDAEVKQRIDEAFHTIFFDPVEKFYQDLDSDSGCMVDTGNVDARTEGMSYGMMMAVQMDRKDLFDKLWTFSRRYMYQQDGEFQGYFAWSCALDGKHNYEGPAPDGEEYYALALFFAAARWGDGEGIFCYSEEAKDILKHMVHQKEMVPGGGPMMHPENHYILFVPDSPFTDPSYHLPHFYTIFSERVEEEEKEFWAKAAEASIEYIIKSAHPISGMSPEYGEFDGRPVLRFKKPYAYYSDAYRVAENIALYTIWNGENEEFSKIATNLQNFFHSIEEKDFMAYDLDGTPHDEPARHPVAMTAVFAAASILSKSPYRKEWLERFWKTPLRKGERRYYDNCLYFFCLLMLGGEYRVY